MMKLKQDQALDSLSKLFITSATIRLVVSFFVMIWGIAITASYSRAKTAEEKDNIKLVHSVWFGDTSVFKLLLYIWGASLLILLFLTALPALKQLNSSFYIPA